VIDSRGTLAVVPVAAACASAALWPGRALAAFGQAWPAFALVAGLLLIGAAAAREGVFAAAGALVARSPGGAIPLLAGLLLVEAVVTAVLNLDTAVVFLTPVLLHAARRRGVPEEPFLYGSVFMANAASLLLPGSNLTNLIVLDPSRAPASAFAARLAPAWAAAVVLTIAFVALAFRRELRGPGRGRPEAVRAHFGPGGAGIAVATVLVLALAQPALPMLAAGLAVAAVARLRPREIREAVSPALLLAVLALAVLLGAVARSVSSVGRLTTGAGRWESAGLAAAASLVVNNLPAAVLLSARMPAHPGALLLGLDLGPDLGVTGSLSALLWLRVARANGARPSALRYTLLGTALVPLSLAVTLLVTAP
jgi:arsenical pump membrane protein